MTRDIFVLLGALAACSATASKPDAGSELERHAEIGVELLGCDEHADCRLVDTSCSACCHLEAIASDRVGEYGQLLQKTCDRYAGGICRCAPPDLVARCEDGACVGVARAEIEDCYSPTQHTWSAMTPGAVGCHCAREDARQCTSDGALDCESTGTSEGPAWNAVADESCVPRKLDDAVDAGDPDAVTLHLFVVPHSDVPVPIDVLVNDTLVATGHFEYGNPSVDPGRIYDFDVVAQGPTVRLRAEAPDAELEESIDAPAERWLILELREGDGFSLRVSETAVGFD